jgi:hypothetical protein
MSPDGRLLYFVGDCHYGWPVIFSIDHGLSTSDFTPALEQFLGTGGRVDTVGDHPADDPVAG